MVQLESIKHLDFTNAEIMMAAQAGDTEKVLELSFRMTNHIRNVRHEAGHFFEHEKKSKRKGITGGLMFFLESMGLKHRQ
ncbi:hypothetical protein [Risungbinella massiliensis]|uniref:hypothetical protein n=1 Tax=Risungbinella massiliensis TaxID=1329796 RepID=UPI0005CC0794|nr:hypothetical protein [Risungbinella massiliensis]